MKKSIFIAASVLCFIIAGCTVKETVPELNYEELNAQALEEYLQPVHPGIRGEVPFWNKYATKYIYAPAFDFDDVENAVGYTYTAESRSSNNYTQGCMKKKAWLFKVMSFFVQNTNILWLFYLTFSHLTIIL